MTSSKEKAKAASSEVIDFTDDDDDADEQPIAGPSSWGMWADVFAPTQEVRCMVVEAQLKNRLISLRESSGSRGSSSGFKKPFSVLKTHSRAWGHPDKRPLTSCGSTGCVRCVAFLTDAHAQRILLLTGPAGAGKTTTIRVLAKEMGLDLDEWGEGADEYSLGAGFGKLLPSAPCALTFQIANQQSPNLPHSCPEMRTVR